MDHETTHINIYQPNNEQPHHFACLLLGKSSVVSGIFATRATLSRSCEDDASLRPTNA